MQSKGILDGTGMYGLDGTVLRIRYKHRRLPTH